MQTESIQTIQHPPLARLQLHSLKTPQMTKNRALSPILGNLARSPSIRTQSPSNPSPIVELPLDNLAVDKVGEYAILDDIIGIGSYAKVRLGRHLVTGERIAVKVIEAHLFDHPDNHVSFEREIAILKSLSHPNIVGFLGHHIDIRGNHCLLMEYVAGGDLFNFMALYQNHLDERTSRIIFKQLVAAIGYLHSKSICHRDLKLENILVQKSPLLIKLTDFGLATVISPSQPLTDRCGTEPYAAPEILQGLPYSGSESDIWALGVILYCLIEGVMPFVIRPGNDKGCGHRGMLHRICRGEVSFKSTGTVVSLIKSMLTPTRTRRATIEAISNHPWIYE